MADDLLTMKIAIDDRDYLKVQNSQKKFQYSLVEIERAYRKGELTSKQYNRQLVIQSKQLQKLGFDYNRASSQVRQYSFALRNATEEQLNHAQAMSLSGKGMRRFELFAQQAGYQVGDFAVQVQSGTNVAVAFGQQASQLLGFLGPKGAIAGAGIAIATGFLAPLLKSKDATRDLNEELEELERTLGEVTTGAKASIEAGLTSQLVSAQAAVNELIARTQSEDFKRAMSFAGASTGAGMTAQSMIDAELEGRKELVGTLEQQVGQAQILETQERVRATLMGDQVQEAQNLQDAQRLIKDAEQDRFKELVKNLADATEEQLEYLETQEKIRDFADQQATKLEQENALLQMRLQFGDEALSVKQLEKDIAVENYEAELLRKGVAEDTVKQLAEQYRISLNLKQQLKEMAEITYNFAPTPAVEQALRRYGGRSTVSGKKPIFGESGKSIYAPAVKPPPDVVGDMLRQIRHQTKLLDLTEEERRKEEILFDLKSQDVNMSDKRIDQLIKEAEAYYKLNEERDKQQVRIDQIGDAFGDMLMSVVDGTAKADEAFKSFMASVLKQLYQEMAIDPAVSFLKSILADGGVMSRGRLTAFANGGVVNGPTVFPMANGMGLMGEAGPEAIMPLKRGPDGKLGVEGGGGVTVVQNINVSTGVQQTVRTEIKSLMPQIAEASKAAVADAKRRGGSYGRNFA
jgi:hypothetical protein